MAFKYKKKTMIEPVKTTWVESTTYEGKKYFFNPSGPAIQWAKPEELKTKEEKEKSSGKWIWAPHKTDYWVPAKVVSEKSDGSTVVQPFGGTAMTIPKDGMFEGFGRKQKVDLSVEVNHIGLDYLEDDVIALEPVDEQTILHNLNERYKRKQIYTWVGAGRSILLSLNPYEVIPELYDDATMQFHKSSEDALKPDKWVPPHVFAIANQAYDAMIARSKDQSILVNGESGSGKTEATKQLLEFLAKQVGSDAEEHHVAEKLVVSNPLLEAFGNAKTIRNHNSSRFGKWIKVTFSRVSNKISGAKFVNFMLEKTRVIHHQEHERNYHIFYQLCLDEELSASLGLEPAKKYRYLNQCKELYPKSIDDREEFAVVRKALNEMEISADFQMSIFKIVAGILNMGQLRFKDEDKGGNVIGSKVVDDSWLKVAADFFGVGDDDFKTAITHRIIQAGKEKTQKPLTAEQAQDAADSLAKSVYGKLFDYLVKEMNESMAPPEEGNFIGILDIFGFEVLENNSFEQLCINFCNEKLQNYLNRHVFTSEEEFYKNEGVEFHFLEFKDNQDTLDLFEATKPALGMLRMLDDEGKVGKGSDTNWLSKVEKQFAGHPKIEFDKRRKFQSDLSFEINHYAGQVKYDAAGFVVKNKDTLWVSLLELMSGSQDPVVKAMFPSVGTTSSKIKPVAGQFRENLNDLLRLCDSTEARFIRCIKANQKAAPLLFDAIPVNEQLTFSGVYESVDIRKGGYPFRLRHKQFAYRFMCINQGENFRKSYKYTDFPDDEHYWGNICREILKTHDYEFDPEDIKVGNSMVLYRVKMYKPLRLLRNLSIEVRMPFLQSFVRGCIGRYYAKEMHKAHRTFEEALELGNDIALVRRGFEEVHDTKKWLAEHAPFLPEYPMFLYERGRYLEERLMAWEEHQKVMEGFTDGLTPDVVTVAQYKDIYASVQKADAPKEEGGLADVVRTDAQVKLYAFATMLLTESQPGWVTINAPLAFAQTKDAPKEYFYKRKNFFKDDRAYMTKVRDKAIEIGYEDGLPETETVQNIKDELERLKVLDATTLQACVRRGMAAYYLTQVAEAKETLTKAMALGNDIVLLRQGFDQGDSTADWLSKMSQLPESVVPKLYEEGRALEERLVAWEEHQAYMEDLIDGKTEMDITVDLYIELKEAIVKADAEKADGGLADVVRTDAQKALYEKIVNMIKDSEPGQVDAESGPALESLVRADMQAVKDKADRIGYSTETTKKIDYVLERLLFIDGEAPDALEVMDGVRMHKVLEEARGYKHTSETIEKIDSLFALPEKEFVQMELEAAVRLGDKKREIHRRIRLKEIFYDEEGAQFANYLDCGDMRPGEFYAKSAGPFCGKNKVIEGQFKWTKGKLFAPLTKLPNEQLDAAKKEIPDEIKEKTKAIKKQFKNLQYAMGDKKSKKAEQFTQEFLQFGIDNPENRTELYCQIIKQITENPDDESKKKGYDVLALCLRTFLPAENFVDYLVMWIRQHPDLNDEVTLYTSALHQKQFEEDETRQVPALNTLRKDIRALKEEGSRFSIPIGAFTGPSNQSHMSIDVRKYNQKFMTSGNLL
mmetsp:Transcript_11196/g.12942  ORF Transcript_11196/g.12942 Transcript_11196/m.12942 type:complete len:1567 (+) Transcript_11196:219-4919(+)